MSKNTIEKIIAFSNGVSSEFTFSNPLLDRNVTAAVSKSIVKTLYKSNQYERNPKVRRSMLQTLRNMCKTAPEGHIEIDEDLTEAVIVFYEKQLTQSTIIQNIEKELDTFLIRKLKAMNLSTSFQSSVKPEVLQAMLNLNDNISLSENVAKDLVHWNVNEQQCKTVLENLWNDNILHTKCFYDNMCIKMKSQIECVLLNISHRLLENESIIDNEIFSNNDLASLVNACSVSADCFQISTGILNSLFISTNFNKSIEKFIIYFTQNVRLKATVPTSVLYPVKLCSLVVVLDINLNELPSSLKESYVKLAKNDLKTLHSTSKNEFIMLMSHFPKWFNIYFEN